MRSAVVDIIFYFEGLIFVFSRLKISAPVVKWISQEPPKLLVQVRFLPGANSSWQSRGASQLLGSCQESKGGAMLSQQAKPRAGVAARGERRRDAEP